MTRYGLRAQPGRPISELLNDQSRIDIWPQVFNSSTKTIQASLTPHTKGAWVELVASTSSHAGWLIYNYSNFANGTATSGLLDIGIGGAGSEQVLIENLPAGYSNNSTQMVIPVDIPANTRISARTQSVIASRNGSYSIALMKRTLPFTVTGIDTINADPTTSGPLVKFSTTGPLELIDSSTSEYRAIVMAYVMTLSTAIANSANFIASTSTGGAGSEQVIAQLAIGWNNSEHATYGPVGLSPSGLYIGTVQQGTRLSATFANASINDGVILYGVKGQ